MSKIFSAVKAIIKRGDKYLVIKQTFSDIALWDFPGGRIEYGENPYDALKREVKEETNLDISVLRALGLSWFIRRDNSQVVCTVFLCKSKNFQEIDMSNNPDEKENIEEYRFVTKEEFLSDEYKVSHKSFKDIFELL